jgi:hypothetical protein
MRQFRRFLQIALADQFQPVGNVVVNRTFPFTVRVTTLQTAIGLFGRRLIIKIAVDFTEFLNANFGVEFFRVDTTYI